MQNAENDKGVYRKGADQQVLGEDKGTMGKRKRKGNCKQQKSTPCW